MSNSDEAWQRWSEIDPYFGVLADERFRKPSFADHREEFWTIGALYVAAQVAKAERHFGVLTRRRALDFGCGVGRLSLPLADMFEQVVGLDVAPVMLAEAQRNLSESGAANLSFALSDDHLSAATGRFDMVMSCIVLQHIPVKRGMAILNQLLDRVEVGGVLSLQICIDRHDTPMSAARYWAQRYMPGAQGVLNRIRGRPVGEPLMQMNAYSLSAVIIRARNLGFGPAIVETHYHGRFHAAEILMQRVSGTL